MKALLTKLCWILPVELWPIWNHLEELYGQLLHDAAYPRRDVFAELQEFLLIVARFEDRGVFDLPRRTFKDRRGQELETALEDLRIIIHSAGRGKDKMNRADYGRAPRYQDIWLGNGNSGLTAMPLSDVVTILAQREKQLYADHARRVLEAHHEPLISLIERIRTLRGQQSG